MDASSSSTSVSQCRIPWSSWSNMLLGISTRSYGRLFAGKIWYKQHRLIWRRSWRITQTYFKLFPGGVCSNRRTSRHPPIWNFSGVCSCMFEYGHSHELPAIDVFELARSGCRLSKLWLFEWTCRRLTRYAHSETYLKRNSVDSLVDFIFS